MSVTGTTDWLSDLLLAISVIESGCDDTVISKTGDRGRYQISEGVWYTHTSFSFTLAHNQKEAHRVAAAHINYLTERISSPTVYTLALAWHAGLKGHRKPTKTQKDYAQRVANYFDVLRVKKHEGITKTNAPLPQTLDPS